MPTLTPTPPTLEPFASTATPNLMAGGPYDTVLTQIMEYLASLKSYLDTQFTTLEGDVTELGTELNDLSGAVGAWDKSEHQNVSMAEFCGNMVGNYQMTLPDAIDSGGADVDATTSNYLIIGNNGSITNALGNTNSRLYRLIGNLMLAAPNGDHTQLFGYLGDNSESLAGTAPTVRSSAALTYAAESGGTAGNVYGVPVDLASDGTVTLAVGGSVTIHQNETLFVCSSEYEGFTAGTIAEYNGSSSVELSDSAGQNIAAELVAVYVPTGGTAEVPVGTLSVQGEYNQVFKKTENGTEPAVGLLISEDQFEIPITSTKPLTIIGSDGDVPCVQFVKPNAEGGLDVAFALAITPNYGDNPNITASDLASAKKVPMNFNPIIPNGYALILE